MTITGLYDSLFYETDGAVIKNVNADVVGYYVGGLVEYAENTLIDNCNVEIYADMLDELGGIAYYTYNTTITNCSVYADGDVYCFGGIVYEADYGTVIANCVLSDCDIYADCCYGGMVNYTYGDLEIYNCVNNDYIDSDEAGAIVCGGPLSGMKLENNFYIGINYCYDVCYDSDEDDYCSGMTDAASRVSEEQAYGMYIPAKLNEYIEENPVLVEDVELNKWSTNYDYETCFADNEYPEVYSINQNGIKVATSKYEDYAYGAWEDDEIIIDYVPKGAVVKVTDENGNEIKLTEVAADNSGAELMSEIPEDVEISLLSDETLEEDTEIDYYTFKMPASDVTISVTLDAGIEETTEIDGKTYAVVKTADDFIKAVTSIANGNNTLNVLLDADITLTAEKLADYPVYSNAAASASDIGYNGVFDGNGHTVTFDGYAAEENAAMLFLIGEDGVVKNITVDGNISGTNAAGIAMFNSGTLLNCINKADISGTNAAGLVYVSYPMSEPQSYSDIPKMINCINKGNINGTEMSAAVACNSMAVTYLVVNEGTITNPGENGNMLANGNEMGQMYDLTDETMDITLSELAAELNSDIEQDKAMIEAGEYPSVMESLAWLFEGISEWSVLETENGTEMVFADEENLPYYVFVNQEGAEIYKAGDTVEFTFDTSVLEEGFELSDIRVVMMYKDDEIELTAVADKEDTYTFTMPNGTCQSEMITEAAGMVKDEDGYYLVATLDDLQKVKNIIEAGNTDINIRLTADIEGYTGTPIGGAYGYNGTFDGNNHSITVNIEDSENEYDEFGLFGILDNDAVVKDLTINGSITARAKYMGAIAGVSHGAIVNCTNNAVVTNNREYDYTGGIVGGLYTSVYEPESEPQLMADEETDEESVFSGLIRNCENNGDVVGYYVGGIASDCWNEILAESTITIEDCVNNAQINGEYVGGIIGYMNGVKNNIADLNNCVNNGSIYADEEAGGIVANAEYAVIDNCVNNAYVETNGYIAGGIVADANGELVVQNCENNGDVYIAYWSAGGIVGDAEDNIEIVNCINNGNVEADYYAAGIVLGSDSVKVKNCYNSGNVTAEYNATAIMTHWDYADEYYGGMSLMSAEEDTTNESDIVIKNSFYIQNDSVNTGLESSNIPLVDDESMAVTEADVTSGYVAAKLNSCVTEGLNSWAVKDGAVVFADSDDEEVEVYYEVIINENIKGGTITADKACAKAGETVTLTFTAETEGQAPIITGVELDENNSFVMPAETVRINAIFGDRFTGTEKSDVIELAENVKADDILLADYVKFENDAIEREFAFKLAEGSTLPEGLKLSYGRIVGTPVKAGEYTVVFDVTDNGAGEVSLMALEPETAIGEAQLTLTINVAKTYKVNIGEVTNGSVTADKTYAKVGELVTLTVTPDEGYVLSEISGVAVGENNTFTMPAKDITISATFVDETVAAKEYTITIEDAANGSVAVDKTVAKMGEKIMLTITPDEGYMLSEITGIEVDENNSFIMPARDVTISAVFKEIPVGEALINGTAGDDGKHIVSYTVPEGVAYTLIVAKYNDDGSLKGVEITNSADDTNNGELIVDSSENVKVMLWSSVSEMLPLCNSYEVK